jgi:hypothetical protein
MQRRIQSKSHSTTIARGRKAGEIVCKLSEYIHMHMHRRVTDSIGTLLHMAQNKRGSEHKWAKLRVSYKQSVHNTKTAPNTRVRELKYKPKYRFQNEEFYLCTNGLPICCKPKGNSVRGNSIYCKSVNVSRTVTTKLPYKNRKS